MWGNAIYLRRPKRRPVRWDCYRRGEDLQDCIPYGWCAVCGREVYERFAIFCGECRRFIKEHEQAT